MPLEVSHDRPVSGRLALIGGVLAGVLDAARITGDDGRSSPAAVLDCGGGSGSFAVPLAVSGAQVTVVDISADALATLRRRAQEAGVSDLVSAVQGDAESLTDLVPGRRFDLVLAHGILESVDDVPTTFTGLAAMLAPLGVLSVVVSNPVATVLARALSGDPVEALAELERLDTAGRIDPAAVQQLCTAAGLVVTDRHGIGVFSDLVPGAALDVPGARDAVAALDAAAADRSPFTEIAARVHLLARRR